MASSLLDLVNNLSEVIHKINCKFRHDDKNIKLVELIISKCWDCFLEYKIFKDDLIEYKCLCCNKNCQQNFDKKLKEEFFNTHTFSNHYSKKFILLLRKGLYQYMDDWEKFNETSLPEEEDFNSHFNMEDINDAHYAHAKQACEDFEIKSLRQYHDLYACYVKT